MRKWMFPFLFVGISVSSTVFAQDACNPNDISQQAMNICAAADYDAADAKLNKLYGELAEAAADEATLKLLRKSQRASLVFRDSECDYAASDSLGGSIYPLLVSQCLTRLTEARIAQLKADANCEGGGDCDAGK